jgi:hypothetical protein
MSACCMTGQYELRVTRSSPFLLLAFAVWDFGVAMSTHWSLALFLSSQKGVEDLLLAKSSSW